MKVPYGTGEPGSAALAAGTLGPTGAGTGWGTAAGGGVCAAATPDVKKTATTIANGRTKDASTRTSGTRIGSYPLLRPARLILPWRGPAGRLLLRYVLRPVGQHAAGAPRGLTDVLAGRRGEAFEVALHPAQADRRPVIRACVKDHAQLVDRLTLVGGKIVAVRTHPTAIGADPKRFEVDRDRAVGTRLGLARERLANHSAIADLRRPAGAVGIRCEALVRLGLLRRGRRTRTRQPSAGAGAHRRPNPPRPGR